MKQEHINEIKAVTILAVGMLLFASLISFVPEDLPWYTSTPNVPAKNLIRITGAYAAGGLYFLIGYCSYTLVLFLFFWSWNRFTGRDIRFTISKFLCAIILFVVISSFLCMTGPQEATLRFGRGGMVGLITADFLTKSLGVLGAYIVLFMMGTLSLIVTGEFLITPAFLVLWEKLQKTISTSRENVNAKKPAVAPLKAKIHLGNVSSPKPDIRNNGLLKSTVLPGKNPQPSKADENLANKIRPEKPKIKITEPTKRSDEPIKEEPAIVGEYHLPPLSLLDDAPQIATNKLEGSLMSGAKLLEETLASFGVEAKVVDIERGPAITRYELEPAAGVKVQKFTILENDIALAMKAPTVRIVAPIPGKNRVGIEVPNDSSASVYLKDVLSSDEFQYAKTKLKLALGKDIAGKAMIADLTDMPHLLIAGTTGSGKTVCVNGIIMSILLSASPDEVKFVMVDPKMVEMAQYNDIPHLLCPTVTDAKKAAGVLNWVVGEMESRYRKLSKDGTRNISAYNEKGNKMPYIVVIIDELADLMQVAAKGVESAITRLAQLSRAVGIHLILATQRPSVNVITGVIKANFPARVSFKVASKVDSRTVLDMNGAETLLGKGDMLFMKPGDAKPTRGQCSFVKDAEIGKVIQFIKDQQAPAYDETIMQGQTASAQGGSQEQDEYFDEAVRLVIETNQASVSILQRRMRLGYTRAARLIDMMEQAGIVGPYVGSKPREILVDREQWLLDNMPKDKENDSPQQ